MCAILAKLLNITTQPKPLVNLAPNMQLAAPTLMESLAFVVANLVTLLTHTMCYVTRAALLASTMILLNNHANHAQLALLAAVLKMEF